MGLFDQNLSPLLDNKYHKGRNHVQFFSLFNFEHLGQYLERSRCSINMCWMNEREWCPIAEARVHRAQQQRTVLATRLLTLKGLWHGNMTGRQEKACQFRVSPKSFSQISEEAHLGHKGLNLVQKCLKTTQGHTVSKCSLDSNSRLGISKDHPHSTSPVCYPEKQKQMGKKNTKPTHEMTQWQMFSAHGCSGRPFLLQECLCGWVLPA